MKQLLIATRNPGKVREFAQFFADIPDLCIHSLNDLQCPDVEETGNSFQANALLKAQAGAAHSKMPTLADDSGLEVDALDGQPGIGSRRFAGPDATDAHNNAKLLEQLQHVEESARGAQFRCVLAWVNPAHEKHQIHYEEGICRGYIAFAATGTKGFGYDPIFIPEGYQQSFATLGPEIKRMLSHRARAWQRMSAYICSQLDLRSH